ncbi:hypothetical protein G4Z16_08935 [Streptomyces bathyalis]|uniref:PepSY domain-containing protein n=1 Tax=Streptomyces bathyalis TaxID=2710756 RepID=A0A7T1WRH5_9ACTN|nr:PepSY domain-containing protein [Streptomyces bathyalis]QPP06506.1 hypothetical protein G4Z16_08935 [Streptomyces bathyalis]
MKRKLAIATVTALALIGGGSVAASASDDANQPAASSASSASSASAASSAGADDRDDDRVDDKDDGKDDGKDDKDDGRNEGRAAADAGTTAADAAAAALKTAPGTVTSIDLEAGKQGPVWEVDVTKGGTSHEVRLDGNTKKVLSERTEQEEDAVPGSKLTAEDVARKAAERGTVTAVEFDDDAKSPTWEVETTDKGKETELTVDGRSGKVTQSAADHEDDLDQGEDRDDDADDADQGDDD